MGQKVRTIAKKVGTAVGGVLLSTIIGALLKGDSLRGVAEVRRLPGLLRSPVPFWSLLIAIGTTLFLLSIASRSKIWGKAKVPGLLAYHPKFSAYDYERSMQSEDLLVVFNDGKSWFSNHREALERRVFGRGQQLRVLVLHPRSDFLKTYIRKADSRTLEEEMMYLNTTFRRVEELRKGRPGLVEIRGHFLFNPYILHLTETEALVHPFFLHERGELPIMVYRNDGTDSGLYCQYKNDAEKAWRDASPLSESDFT